MLRQFARMLAVVVMLLVSVITTVLWNHPRPLYTVQVPTGCRANSTIRHNPNYDHLSDSNQWICFNMGWSNHKCFLNPHTGTFFNQDFDSIVGWDPTGRLLWERPGDDRELMRTDSQTGRTELLAKEIYSLEGVLKTRILLKGPNQLKLVDLSTFPSTTLPLPDFEKMKAVKEKNNILSVSIPKIFLSADETKIVVIKTYIDINEISKGPDYHVTFYSIYHAGSAQLLREISNKQLNVPANLFDPQKHKTSLSMYENISLNSDSTAIIIEFYPEKSTANTPNLKPDSKSDKTSMRRKQFRISDLQPMEPEPPVVAAVEPARPEAKRTEIECQSSDGTTVWAPNTGMSTVAFRLKDSETWHPIKPQFQDRLLLICNTIKSTENDSKVVWLREPPILVESGFIRFIRRRLFPTADKTQVQLVGYDLETRQCAIIGTPYFPDFQSMIDEVNVMDFGDKLLVYGPCDQNGTYTFQLWPMPKSIRSGWWNFYVGSGIALPVIALFLLLSRRRKRTVVAVSP
ncbi:MAG: hypothetical protein ACRC8S_16795 [Fimbriiglobus sp.]